MLAAAWKHKVVFGTVVVLAFVVSLVFAGFSAADSTWSAEALLVLRDPASVEGAGTSERFISEQVEILRSPIVANAAAEALEESHPEYEVTADELLEFVGISSSTNSGLVFLSVTDEDSERAVAVVNSMAETYQQVSRLEATQNSTTALERIDAQLESLEQRFIEIGPEVDALRSSDPVLSELKAQFRDALNEIVQLQAQLPAASGEAAAAIRQGIADYRSRVDTYREAIQAEGTTAELRALLEEQDQLITRRSDLLTRRDQISIDAEVAPGAVSLLDTADEATEVADLGLGRILAVGLVLGLLAAFASTYLLELRSRRFAGRREPESILGAPLLADIPHFTAEGLSTRLPVRDDPRTAAAESFRFAAASIGEAMRNRGLKSVMAVGATLGHGKSTCVINTAMADVRQGHSVLLIDADFGNQDATQMVMGDHPSSSPGLIEMVEDDVPFQSAVNLVTIEDGLSLDLLSRGSKPTVAINLLSQAEAGVVFRSARDTYDMVFVDAPPLLQVAYASTLANLVDALVVVVAHGTPVRELEELVNRLELIDTPVIGYLYNRSPLRREMRASDGSMVDILGERGLPPVEETSDPGGRRSGSRPSR